MMFSKIFPRRSSAPFRVRMPEFCEASPLTLMRRLDVLDLELPPACPRCNALVRPRVVLFGESLPQMEMEQLLRTLDAGPDMVFSIGTSSLFPYVAEPVLWASEQGITTVEINPGTTPVSPFADHHITQGAAATLEALWQRLR